MAATTSVSALNGAQTIISSPFRPPFSPTSKRKRSASPGILQESLVSSLPSQTIKDVNIGVNIDKTIYQIWQLLQRHDTTTRILRHPITVPVTSNGSKVSGHNSKRIKATEPSEPKTITAKVHDGLYLSPEELLSDIDIAYSEICDREKSLVNGSQRDSSAVLPRTEQLYNELDSFRNLARSLVQRTSTIGQPQASSREVINGGTKHREHSQNVVKQEDSDFNLKDKNLSKTVLTLFGNAQGHKQLFSSFPKAPVKHGDNEPVQHEAQLVKSIVKPVVSLRESGLPNGISSTKIYSTSTDEAPARSKPRTLLDTFAPPTSLPPLVPPRAPRTSSSRQNTVTWMWPKSATPKASLVHSQQRLAVGHWIGYEGISSNLEPSSPENKRKQRDRTLSTGEVGTPVSDAVIAAQLQAKEEALFRSSYSSFAPTRDNSVAIYSEETKSQIWWQRTGENQFHQLVDQGITEDTNAEVLTIEESPVEDEDVVFKKVVEAFDPQLLELELQANASEVKDQSGDTLLKEISELLEMVHSYQRIRNSCLNTTARSSIAQKSSVQELMGTPSIPSTSEQETYDTLKAQLALIVAMMPPHAVAKLNGDQLEELNIRSSIPLEQTSYRGVMEEDQAYRTAKLAAQTAAAGPGPLTRGTATPTPISATPGQARTAPMTALSRSAAQPQQYGAGAPSLGRQTSGLSRQPLSAWQTPTQSYGASTQRQQSYTGQQAYGQQQMSRPVQSSNMRQPFPPSSAGRVPTSSHTSGIYGAGFTNPPAYQQRAQNYAATMANFNLQNTPQQQQPGTTNTRMYGSPQTDANQYTRAAGYQYTPQAQPSMNTTGVAPISALRPRSKTPGGTAMSPVQPSMATWSVKQSQSPAPASVAAVLPPNIAMGSPQVPQDSQVARP